MIRGVQAARSVQSNIGAWDDLCDDLLLHVAQMETWQVQLENEAEAADKGCLESLNHYLRTAAEVIKGFAEREARGHSVLGDLKRAGTVQTEKEEILRQRERAVNSWQAFLSAMNMRIFQGIGRIERTLTEFDTTRVRSEGPSPRTVYGNKVEVCEEGTRTEILAMIRRWASDVGSEKQILWLSDAAGTGKSTIAATMAKEWHAKRMLAGRFLFSPNDVKERTTENFCLRIAEDIMVNQAALSGVVRMAIKETPCDHFSFDQQFERLLAEPLQRHTGAHSLCIVIDALDNCDDRQERRHLLRLLKRHLPSMKHVKTFLTSRPVQDIFDELEGCPLVDGHKRPLSHVQNYAQQDIQLYVEKRLSENPLISIDHRRMIVLQSGGLFLYAATMCRMIENERRRKVPAILDALTMKQPPKALENKMDELYLSVLKQACLEETDMLLMEVLSMIIIAFQPLSTNTLRVYLPGNDQVADILHDLGAVLKMGDEDAPINVLHPTFREFLLSNKERAHGFFVDTAASHERIVYSCLDTLERSLRYNILQFEDPDHLGLRNTDVPDVDQLLASRVDAATHYASVYWPRHAMASARRPTLWIRIFDFLGRSFLNWVELMSWRGSIVACIDGLSSLRAHAQQVYSGHPGVLTEEHLLMIQNMHQFVVYHQGLLSGSALQTYSVPLFLTPRHSTIFQRYRQQYRAQQPRITASHIAEWGNHMILEYSGKSWRQLIFSSDGTRLMCGGAQELFLWDAETGALVRHFSGTQIISYIFSPDGCHLAFTTRDQLQVHLSNTGEQVGPSFSFDLKQIKGVLSLPSDLSLRYPYATVIHDHTAQIFNFETGEKGETKRLAGDGRRDCTFFSPDGKVMVSADSLHQEATLWAWENLTPLTTVKTRGQLTCGNFSVDGGRFASWNGSPLIMSLSQVEGLQIWDVSVTKGIFKIVMELPLEEECSYAIFSASSSYIAFRTSFTINIWNCRSKREVLVLDSKLDCYSFSPDEQKLAVIRDELTIQIWAIPTGEALYAIRVPLEIYPPSALSPDWTKFVSFTGGRHQLSLLDLQEGSYQSIQDQDSHIAFYFAITEVGPLLFGVDDEASSIRFWDVITGEENKPAIPLGVEALFTLELSPNGQTIAVASHHRTSSSIHFWSIPSRVRHRTGIHVGKPLKECRFSPTSTYIAASSEEHIDSSVDLHELGSEHSYISFLGVWDIDTKDLIWQFSHEGDWNPYSFLAFSPNGSTILRQDAGSIYIANFLTQDRVIGPQRSRNYVDGALSPTRSLVAILFSEKSGVSEWGIDLWKIDTDTELVATIWTEDNSPCYQLTFSNDGLYVAYGLEVMGAPYCPIIAWDGYPKDAAPPIRGEEVFPWELVDPAN
ncbi:hypothetical protein FRC17_002913, partial [Serendipita sp. 399]